METKKTKFLEGKSPTLRLFFRIKLEQDIIQEIVNIDLNQTLEAVNTVKCFANAEKVEMWLRNYANFYGQLSLELTEETIKCSKSLTYFKSVFSFYTS